MTIADDKRAEFLQHEIRAFEGRLSTIHTEISALKKQKEYHSKTLSDAKEAHQQEINAKNEEFRKISQALEEQRTKLQEEQQKTREEANHLAREKTAFAKQQAKITELETEAKKTLEKAQSFLALVREGATKL